MKLSLLILFLFSFSFGYSQNSSKIKEINILVSAINATNLPVEKDTLIQNLPELGLKMTTYLSMIVNNNQLLKYVNYSETLRIVNGVQQKMTVSNTFYYYDNKLIKVEEYLIESAYKRSIEWYYSNDKLLYTTFDYDKSEARAAVLLEVSNAMLKQIIK